MGTNKILDLVDVQRSSVINALPASPGFEIEHDSRVIQDTQTTSANGTFEARAVDNVSRRSPSLTPAHFSRHTDPLLRNGFPKWTLQLPTEP